MPQCCAPKTGRTPCAGLMRSATLPLQLYRRSRQHPARRRAATTQNRRSTPRRARSIRNCCRSTPAASRAAALRKPPRSRPSSHGPARRDSAWAHRARLGGRQADNGACVRRRHGARCWRGPAYRLPASRLLALSLLPPPEPRARLRASRQGAQRAGGTLSDACAVRLWAWRGVHRGRQHPRQPHRLQGASAPSAAARSRLCASGCLSCAGSDRVRRFPGR